MIHDSVAPSDKRALSQIRILSIDGGGVRGIIPAYCINELNKLLLTHLSQSVVETFDWFVGTSTGSIIAAAIATDMPSEKVLSLYTDRSKDIFCSFYTGMRVFNPMRWSGFVFPKHSDSGLNRVLKDAFLNKRMGDIKPPKRLLAIAYDGGSRTPMIFDSQDSRHSEIPVWQVCRASAAAPTYLPESEMSIGGVSCSLLDGGVVANDPSAIALAKVLSMRRDQEAALLVSFGTGKTGTGFNPKRNFKFSGAGPWLKSLTTTLMEGSGGGYGSIVADLMDDRHYFRFDAPLRLSSPSIDNATSKQLAALLTDAKSYWGDRFATELSRKLISHLEPGLPLSLSHLQGSWNSLYTWKDSTGALCEERGQVQIEVLADQFLRGHTIHETMYPGTFEMSQVGISKSLVGWWYNERRTRASTFILTADQAASKTTKLTGPWIGCGDDDSSGKHYEGTWTLTRDT